MINLRYKIKIDSLYHLFYPQSGGKAMQNKPQETDTKVRGWYVLALLIGLFLAFALGGQDLADVFLRMG
jgi:hypothetical protein